MNRQEHLNWIRNDIQEFLDNQISFDTQTELVPFQNNIELALETNHKEFAKDIYLDMKNEYTKLKFEDPQEKRRAYAIVVQSFQRLNEKTKLEPEEEVQINDLNTQKIMLTDEEKQGLKHVEIMVENEKAKQETDPETIKFLIDEGHSELEHRSLRKAAYIYVKIAEIYNYLRLEDKVELRPVIIGFFKEIKDKTFYAALTNLSGFLEKIEKSIKNSQVLISRGQIKEAQRELEVVKSMHNQIPEKFRNSKEKYYEEILNVYNLIKKEIEMMKNKKLI